MLNKNLADVLLQMELEKLIELHPLVVKIKNKKKTKKGKR